MRVTVPLLVAVLAGCTEVENTFEVEAVDGQPQAAVLSACGSETALRQEPRKFTGSRSIGCEGSGHIRLRYSDGTRVKCSIGYVTHGAEQHWRFQARNGECQPLSDKATMSGCYSLKKLTVRGAVVLGELVGTVGGKIGFLAGLASSLGVSVPMVRLIVGPCFFEGDVVRAKTCP